MNVHGHWSRAIKSAGLAVALVVWPWALSIPFGQAHGAQARTLDVVLVLDNSGSMKKNDPDALMGKAAASFAASLPADSRLGIVIFDQAVRLALAITPESSAQFRANVAKALQGIDYRGQWTDIAGGVERALYELRQQGRADAERAVILFTDGVLETGNAAKDAERSRWLRENLTAEAKGLGIRVFGIAFTEGADFQLLQSVAQASGGEHYRVLAPADIGGVFERVRARIQAHTSEEVRKRTEAAPIVTQPSPPAPQSAYPWTWVFGLALALSVLAWAVLRLHARPAIHAHLRDLGSVTGKERYALRRKLTRIGRDPRHNDLVIARDTVSAQHAEIEIRGASFYLRDLGSSNHTYVNGRQIGAEHVLKHTDTVRFDAFEFELAIAGYAAAPAQPPGAAITPGGTRLRDPAHAQVPAAAPAAARASGAAAAIAPTQLKTGKCNVHSAWDAVAVCPSCSGEKCAQCMTQRNGVDLCTDCAAALARAPTQ